MDAILDKNSNIYKHSIVNLTKKIPAQEKIVDLEILQEQHGWKVAERIN